MNRPIVNAIIISFFSIASVKHTRRVEFAHSEQCGRDGVANDCAFLVALGGHHALRDLNQLRDLAVRHQQTATQSEEIARTSTSMAPVTSLR